MRSTTNLGVFMQGMKVGTLALADNLAAFEYDDAWLSAGFSLNPLSLPLEKKVFIPRGFRPFDGLFGVFSDSLPDGWGRLLLDRLLRKMGESPDALGCLDRLAIVGDGGMGALEYAPSIRLEQPQEAADFDALAREARKLFNDEYSEDLDRLYHLGGSSGGARPKVLVDVDSDPWIVKFHTQQEGPRAGEMEYAYALCAQACGIEMPAVRLLPSDECAGYFAVKRFDRTCVDGQIRKVHMATASALFESSHRVPNLDYTQLMKLTAYLTNDHAQLRALYRRMCFNVFAHNRDDHSKNFSYLCEKGVWRLSPAYDLTFSNSLAGEHATTVDGNGTNPGMEDLLRVVKAIDLDTGWAIDTAREISLKVAERLGAYL